MNLNTPEKLMMDAVTANFTQMKGRPPTEIELVSIMSTLHARIADPSPAKSDISVDAEDLAVDSVDEGDERGVESIDGRRCAMGGE